MNVYATKRQFMIQHECRNKTNAGKRKDLRKEKTRKEAKLQRKEIGNIWLETRC